MIFGELYKQATDRQLKAEYESFCAYCERNEIALIDFKDEESFARHAIASGYKLGMKPRVKEGCKIATVDTLYFKSLTVIHNRFVKNPKFAFQKIIQGIQAYGIELDSLGWSYLIGSDVSHKSFVKRLNKYGIESIVERRLKTRTGLCLVTYKGMSMPISQALKASGISIRNFYYRLKKDRDHQRVFDRMISESKGGEIINWKNGSILLKISKQDARILEKECITKGKSIVSMFHEFVMSFVEY